MTFFKKLFSKESSDQRFGYIRLVKKEFPLDKFSGIFVKTVFDILELSEDEKSNLEKLLHDRVLGRETTINIKPEENYKLYQKIYSTFDEEIIPNLFEVKQEEIRKQFLINLEQTVPRVYGVISVDTHQ